MVGSFVNKKWVIALNDVIKAKIKIAKLNTALKREVHVNIAEVWNFFLKNKVNLKLIQGYL